MRLRHMASRPRWRARARRRGAGRRTATKKAEHRRSSRPAARSPAPPRPARRPATPPAPSPSTRCSPPSRASTKLANIKGEQISNVGSQDMSFDIMLKVAKRINELLPTARRRRHRDHARHRHDGGDRVLPEPRRSRATSRSCWSARCARRPRSAPTARSTSTTPSASPSIRSAKGRGVLVVMNDWIHAAHSLTKTSTTAVQTFMSPVRGLVGRRQLRQERLLQHAGLEAHDAERVRHLEA